VHLTTKLFFVKTNLSLAILIIWAKIVLNMVESSIFYVLSIALEVLHNLVLGSLRQRLLMTSTQEASKMVPQLALCICSKNGKQN